MDDTECLQCLFIFPNVYSLILSSFHQLSSRCTVVLVIPDFAHCAVPSEPIVSSQDCFFAAGASSKSNEKYLTFHLVVPELRSIDNHSFPRCRLGKGPPDNFQCGPPLAQPWIA
jgi:hypothetical protein